MIKLIPLENQEELERLCAVYGIPYDASVHAYISASRQVKAECIFSLRDYQVELLAAAYEESDPLIPELLIRAVGAYAANRSGYLFHIKKEVGQAMESTLKTMRFEENDSEYCGKVPEVLKGHCCCQ